MENKQLVKMYQFISLTALVKFNVINIEDIIRVDGKYSGILRHSSDGAIIVAIETETLFNGEVQFKSLHDYICAINVVSSQCFSFGDIVFDNQKFQDVARRLFALVQDISSLSDALTAIGLVANINVLETQSNEYLITRYIEGSSEDEFCTDNALQYFTNIGFDYASAQCCDLLVKKNAQMSSQNWSYWTKYFVNIILGYKIGLLPKGVSSTPSIMTNRVYCKFRKDVFAVCSNKDDIDSESEDIFPLNLFGRLQAKMLNGESEQEYYVFFHGTSYRDANSIIAGGINLSKGSNDQDFSHGDGFYLHTQENINLACEWSQRGYGESAIVMFLVLRSDFDELSIHIRDNDLETWREYINLYRRSSMILGGDTDTSEDMYDDYMKINDNFAHDVVFGFGCKNHREVIRSNCDPEPFRWKQVCVRSDYAVNIFHQSRVGVMYL
jgi:hypothetical protein